MPVLWSAKPVATWYLKTIGLCTMCGCRSGVADDSFPLESDTVSLGIKFLTVWRVMVPWIFWGLSSPLVVLDSPWRWRYYAPFKCWDPLVLRCGITSTGPKVLYHPRRLQSLIVSLLGDANLFQSVLTYKRTVPNIWDRTCHKWNILFGTVLLMYIRTISM